MIISELKFSFKIFTSLCIRICFLELLLYSATISAQLLHFSHYTTSQGLLSNNILSMCQDVKGRLWIGTGDGISIYNGESFKNLTPANGLSAPMVNAMLVDKFNKGVIWIGTNGGGLDKYEAGKIRTISIGNSGASNRINSIAEDGKGILWLATDKGVYLVYKNKERRFRPDLFSEGTNAIASNGGKVIIPLHKNLVYFIHEDNGKINSLKLPLESGEEIWSISVEKNGAVWIGTSRGKLFKLFDRKIREINLHIKGTVLFAAKYYNNVLWIGTGEGIFKYQDSTLKKESYTRITEANGLPGRDINCGLIDSEGELWFGLWSNGLVKLSNGNIYRFYGKFSSPIPDNSKSVKDKHDHIWCVEKKGLLEIWKTGGDLIMSSYHRLLSEGSSDELEIIKIDYLGRLIAGFNSGKINYYKIIHPPNGPSSIKELISVQTPFDYSAGNLLYIFPDMKGKLWCSVNGVGVCSFYPFGKKSKAHLFAAPEGLSSKSVRVIYEDSKNNFWFGGFDKGLSEFTKKGNGKWANRLYTRKDGLPDNYIRSITEDKGRLWVGTRYGGIAVLNNNQFKIIDIKDGLLSDGIWCMTKETGNNKIIGTQLGLQKLSAGKSKFRISNLLFGQPCYSCGETTNGLIWASTEKNITVIDEQNKSVINVPPKIFISKVLVNGREIKSYRSIDHDYLQNTFTFDFNGISLRYGRLLSYKYILKGADNTWHKIEGQHAVTYASLRPGNYEFEVESINPNGAESVKPAVLLFSIEPPVWLRWWFITSAFLILGTLIFLVIRIRINRMLEIEKVKGRIATDLHDDIGSGLTRIVIAADVALKQMESAGSLKDTGATLDERNGSKNYSIVDLIKKIGKHARQLVDDMSDVVWSIDPKNKKISDLLSHLRPYVLDICESSEISVEFILSEKILETEINPETLRSLLLIAKEASNNSVKHSGCDRLRIELSIEGNCVMLKVIDNGKGFDAGKISLGYGLINMKKRCESARGTFSSESDFSGTTVTAVIPFK